MGLFSKKPEYCSVCEKELKHKHKPKREWDIKGRLCGDCYMDKAQEFYEGKVRQPCIECKTVKKITDLWEPRWQWDMDGLLCKECFDKKEEKYNTQKNFCCICGKKLGFIRYNPKAKWKIASGQLCRICWDEQKAKSE
jgi:hypothetical protein